MGTDPALSDAGRITYLLPIRGHGPGPELDELTRYLRWMASRAHLLIVDGSDPALFRIHAAHWRGFARHIAPAPQDRCVNGKAWGVRTGLRLASDPQVIIADDDVRYDDKGLEEMRCALAEGADLVRPQNYFKPLPWHAAWDSARTLLNRALGSDHPGTLGIDRSVYLAVGGYDGNVLFENLQLLRSIAAGGGRVLDRPDLFVRRRPPSTRRFLGQRVRQAYDDMAQPARLLASLAVLPVLGWLVYRGLEGAVVAAGVLILALAERGRRRESFAQVVPVRCSLLAPLWVLERGVCSWLAVASRVILGGCPYAGTIVRRAADPAHRLRVEARRRAASRPPDDSRRREGPASSARIGRERPRIAAESPDSSLHREGSSDHAREAGHRDRP